MTLHLVRRGAEPVLSDGDWLVDLDRLVLVDRGTPPLPPGTVTHDQLRDGANPQLYGGWPMILSGLKTWLETGGLLTTPGSLMYG